MAEVIYSRRALNALTNHVDYLIERQPSAARDFLLEIERTAVLLGEFPMLGREVEGLALRYHVTRRFRYRVIYSLKGDVLEIRDVMHPSREWRVSG